MINKIKYFLLSVLLSSWSSFVWAQAPQPTYTLTTNETGAAKSYVAREYVSLKPGFAYSASGGSSFNAKIDQTLIFPPTSNTYATPNGTITTDPTQGGVVGSIPGQFSVSSSGGATYNIPIDCPSGINGMQPSISVGYSSQAGYGALGTGWNISGVSAITRGGKNIYFDSNTEGIKFNNSDALYLDGQRLIYLSGGSGHFTVGAEYATEVEDYARVKILADSNNDIYFQITTQDGKTLEFGKTTDSRIAYLSGSRGSEHYNTLSWKLNKTIDNYGNSIVYSYTSSSTKRTQGQNKQLSKIEYGGKTIEFNYSPNNTYDHIYKVLNVSIVQSGLLESITTKVGSTTLKKYQFVYNNQDKLREVKLSDGNNIAINSSIINWGNTANQPEFKGIGNVANSNLSSYRKGTSSVDFADINGDGYNDRVERWIGDLSTSGFINVYFYNNTTKSYSTTISTSQVITYADSEKFKQQFLFVDINNDGKEEIIYTNNNNLHVLTYKYGNLLPFFTDGRGVFSTKSLLEIDKDDMVKITTKDVNNDSYVDIVMGFYSRGSWDNGERGYAIFFGSKDGLTVNPASYKTNTNYTLNYFDFGDFFDADGKLDMLCIANKSGGVQPALSFDPIIHTNNEYIQLSTNSNWNLNNLYASNPSSYKVIDLNNDGLSDLLYCSSTDRQWRFVKNSGGNSFTNPINDNFTTVLPFSGGDCQFVDINGDGLVDALKFINIYHTETVPLDPVYDEYGNELHDYDGEGNIITTKDIEVYDYTIWKTYVNIGNGNFATPIDFTNNVEINDYDLKTNSDINGDGIADIVITKGSTMYTLTMPHANHQNLVTSVTNGMGLTESVTYKNFSEYELYNANEVNAKVRPLRAPLLVVENQTSVDGTKTVYTFEAPKYHTEGKGFIGFAVLKTSNADNNVKNISYYEFDQTYFFPALRTQSISTIGGDNDISYSSQTNSVKVISSALKRYIPYASIQNNTDALKNLTQTTTTNYDNYPNSLTQTTAIGDLTTSTVTTFTGPPNKTPYLPLTVVTTRTQGGTSFTKETDYSFTYDGANPYKITEKTETVDPGDVNSVATTYSNFDPWGHPQNIAISANGKTRASTVKYYKSSTTEANAGQYLRSRTNVLGETTTYNWNEITGLLDSEIDSRENVTSYKYASFGQLKETIYPDGLRKASTIQWAGSGDVSGAKYSSYTETSGSAPVVVWYDELGRAIQTDSYGLKEKKISVSTEYYTTNDFAAGKRKGMVYRTSEPYFEADAGNKVWAKTLTYDQYGRALKAIIPMGELTNQYNFRTTTVTTPESTTITTLNSAGQVLTSSVNGKTVTYGYYPSGLVKTLTPQDGIPITMVYNKQGKQIRLVDPNSGLIRSEYNGFGELTLSVQRVHLTGDSIKTIHTYKTDGRLESIDRNGEITSYTYSTTPNYQNRINTIELKTQLLWIENP